MNTELKDVTRIGPPITLAQQRAAVVRELGFRTRVYPKWTEQGRMKPEEAAFQMACMQAVLDTVDAQRGLADAARWLLDTIEESAQVEVLDITEHDRAALRAALAKVKP